MKTCITLLRLCGIVLLLGAAALAVNAAPVAPVPTPPGLTTPAPAALPNPLTWTEWALTSPVLTGAKITPYLHFSDGGLSASVGMNILQGLYALDGTALTLTRLEQTLIGGPPPLEDAEQRYFTALEDMQSVTLSADKMTLTLHGGKKTLSFRFTTFTPNIFLPGETKFIEVGPQLGPGRDEDVDDTKAPQYLQLVDRTPSDQWGACTAARIVDFDFVPGYRSELRVVVDQNPRTGQRRLRRLETLSQHWTETVTPGADEQIWEITPGKATSSAAGPHRPWQVRRANGAWTPLSTLPAGFIPQDGLQYRLLVRVTDAEPSLVRLLDMKKM